MAIEAEPSSTSQSPSIPEGRGRVGLLRRITRFEFVAGAVAAVVLIGLVVAEPDVLEAPFENSRTVVFTFGGAALSAVAFLVMLRLRVPALARVLVVGVPFVGVTYWLVEPYFVDDKVDDEFVTSIGDASRAAEAPVAAEDTPVTTQPRQPEVSTPTQPPSQAEPVLLGAGTFRGLAGHDGTGDAGFFALPDGGRVLRLENFDIQNGPDLRLYVVPGADQADPTGDSLYLGDPPGQCR